MPETAEHKIIVIAGPTASGKSGLALDLALALNGEVINADSMQVYKNMPVITACPSAKDKTRVLHHLYEIYEPSVNGTVVDWLNRAMVKIREVWEKGRLPIVVGGTGLYLDNLINGTTPIPECAAEVRSEVRRLAAEKGIGAVYEALAKVDIAAAERLNPNDTSRVTRAYEVWKQTGITLTEWHRRPMVKKLPEAVFDIIKLCPPAEELDSRCYLRFDRMMSAGALEEVRRLTELKLPGNLPAMKALGVPELAAYLNGQCSLEAAVAAGKLHTRQYAKRQRTWFANKLKADVVWEHCYEGNAEEFLKRLNG